MLRLFEASCWSDHCRHTTFLTRLSEVEVEKNALGKVIEDALQEYYDTRLEVYGKDTTRIVSLMDMALIGMKSLKKKGLIPDLDESDEINACSIEVPVTIDGKTEKWLVQFKNETHNQTRCTHHRSADHRRYSCRSNHQLCNHRRRKEQKNGLRRCS